MFYGQQNYSTLRTLDNLGTVYLDLGKIEEARKAHETALNGMRELFGDDNVYTSRAAANLAAAQAKAGNFDAAVALATGAVITLEKIFDTNHNHTLKAAALLGAVMRQNGREEIATKVLSQTAAIANKELGKDHFITKSCEKELKLVDALQKSPQEHRLMSE